MDMEDDKDLLLSRFLKEGLPEPPDVGFTARLMAKLPRKAVYADRILTVSCLVVGAALVWWLRLLDGLCESVADTIVRAVGIAAASADKNAIAAAALACVVIAAEWLAGSYRGKSHA